MKHVTIIGSGITGLAAAYRLEKEAGKALLSSTPKRKKSKSTVVDDGEEGSRKCKADRDVLLILTLVSFRFLILHI